MVYISNFEALGLHCSPFAPKEKRWPIAVAAGISALAGVASSAMTNSSNKSSTEAANATNLEAVREQNAANKQIARETNMMNSEYYQKNLDWLREQYYDTQRYNSPQLMAERYRAAGINPIFAMGNSAGASAASSVGGTSAPNLQTPYMEAGHVDPVHYDYSGLGEAVGHSTDMFFKNQMISQDTLSKRIDNSFKVTQIVSELRNQMADTAEKMSRVSKNTQEYENLKLQYQDMQARISVFMAQMDDLIEQPKVSNELTKAQTDLTRANAEYQRLINQFTPENQKKLLRNLDAEYSNIIASARNNNASAAHNAALAALAKSQEDGVKIDNDVKDSIADALVDKAFSEADSEYWRAQQGAKNFRMGRLAEVPAQSLDGKSYTNHNTHGANRRKAVRNYSKKFKYNTYYYNNK